MSELIQQRGAVWLAGDRLAKGQAGLKRLTVRFAGDNRGTTAIVFALTAIVIVSLVGGAVDYGRWISAKTQNQGALDAAVLAAGRVLQTSGGNEALAVDTARSYYDRMKSHITVNDASNFDFIESGNVVRGVSNSFVTTPFLSLAGVKELPVYIGAQAVLSATGGGGGDGTNYGTSIEISMMLDVTGSMAGSKITDLKDAAKDLIDIVIWNNQSEFTSRVAIAPFAPTVNVGDYFKAVTNEDPDGSPAQPAVYDYPSNCYNSKGKLRDKCKGDSQYLVSPAVPAVPAKAKCVVERTGTYEFKDDAPSNGKWIPSWNTVTGSTSTTCTPAASIMPLTSDKAALKTRIDSFVASGNTAGAVGTAWAWYLISPQWSSIWTGTSAPAPYSELTTINPDGSPKLRKFAVLMTDGEYNRYQDKSTSATTVSSKAVSLCTAMKAKGITVYTVGFQLDSQLVRQTMANCATDASYAYDTNDGEELRQAFRDIALQIATLRIKK